MMEQAKQAQGREITGLLIDYVLQMLQIEVEWPHSNAQDVLKVACEWSAIKFEKLTDRKPTKHPDRCTVMQAGIAASHIYLRQRSDGVGLLYTFGYTMPCADAVIEQLTSLDVVIADVRYLAHSRVPKWRETSLRERLGDHYIRIQALGNVHYNRPGSIQLYQPEVGARRANERLRAG